MLSVSNYLCFNGYCGHDGVVIARRLGHTQVHAEAYWFAGEVYVSEHALQLLWRRTYQDYNYRRQRSSVTGVHRLR